MKYLGVDIGSISVNTVLLNDKKEVLKTFYDFSHGRPFQILEERLEQILGEHDDISGTIALTGTGGKLASTLLDGIVVNEIIAQSKSVMELYPEARTIIEMGGEDSKLIFLDKDEVKGSNILSDFNMNNLCAAGTGSFLDQQAKRIGVDIAGEFGEMALKSEKPPRIAGRCSVFAKSDMIHLQQVATPVYDIIAGLCFAVARNYKSSLGKGKELVKPILFQGGVAANAGMVRAFTEVYNLEKDELIVPEHFASMGAIGAVLFALENNHVSDKPISLEKLKGYLSKGFEGDSQTLSKLIDTNHKVDKTVHPIEGDKKVKAFLGIDVGSLSTNIAVIDDQNRVLGRRYLPTASKPLEAIKRGLAEVGEEIGDKVEITGVGTTGSGRYLVGDFVGADSIQNEITCQATAAIAYDSEVDTIFEIGGQDSKYISIANGVIVDFEMNKVCAAGTGSFLEEQADKLGVNIKEEFGKIGLSAEKPTKLGERCTVFMESDLNTHQQKGSAKDNLIAGLAYSIVYNYLNRVVRDKPVGKKIFFQGGVTNNKAVLAAFEKVTGKSIQIPPHFDITGAIGAAILAREEMGEKTDSNFKGFEVSKTNYKSDNFVCKACSNHCEIKRIIIDGLDRPLYYGGICDKYEFDHNKKKETLPDLFKEREEMLLDGFENQTDSSKTTIGIPRTLMNYYQHFPYWRTFFNQLGFNVVISDETDRSIITKSLETMVSETCLPVELVHGHILNLVDKNVDYIFLPFIVNSAGDKENPTNNPNCPWVQSHPYLAKAAFTDKKIREKLLIPTLHFRYHKHALIGELQDFFNDKFGISKGKVKKAIKAAGQEQELFQQQVKLRGMEVMDNLPKDKKSVVIIGRPYNTGDPSLNLRLVKKLLNMNVLAIPLDYLPLEMDEVYKDYPSMYWPNGQKILAGTKHIANNKNIYAIYLGNFRCGPDSFLLHFVKKEMRGKPYLHLEVDEHSADAGMITRIEAFLDTLKGWENNGQDLTETEPLILDTRTKKSLFERTIYFPFARDTVHVMSAATRSCGIPSEVLPMQDQEDIEIGRKYTNGQECFPMIATLGSFIKKLQQPGVDPKKSTFFMPDHNGPCRFGEYNILQKLVFNDLGYKDAEIVHPTNDDSYASLAPGYSVKWRTNCWKGFIAVDLIRTMLEQTRPYELTKGKTDEVYKKHLDQIINSVENNCKFLDSILANAAREFKKIPIDKSIQKPVVAIVGEIFMRDNPFCSNHLVKRLEDLGAETIMAPMCEWVNYSSIRYTRDSRWKGDVVGLMKSKLQRYFQQAIEKNVKSSISDIFKIEHEISVEEMLENCGEYIHKDYDGDPALAIGSASLMAKKQIISGVVNILPFTCMPGTISCTVSSNFKKDHGGLPWENFAYDGNSSIGIDTRFEAFMHQVHEFNQRQRERMKERA